jgi:hypothetical protein
MNTFGAQGGATTSPIPQKATRPSKAGGIGGALAGAKAQVLGKRKSALGTIGAVLGKKKRAIDLGKK